MYRSKNADRTYLLCMHYKLLALVYPYIDCQKHFAIHLIVYTEC